VIHSTKHAWILTIIANFKFASSGLFSNMLWRQCKNYHISSMLKIVGRKFKKYVSHNRCQSIVSISKRHKSAWPDIDMGHIINLKGFIAYVISFSHCSRAIEDRGNGYNWVANNRCNPYFYAITIYWFHFLFSLRCISHLSSCIFPVYDYPKVYFWTMMLLCKIIYI